MKVGERLSLWFRPLAFLGNNTLSLVGGVLTTSSGITLLLFWGFTIFQAGPLHPYAGILLFLILPGLFVLGLALIPTGALLHRRRLLRRGELPEIYPHIDLRQLFVRRALGLVGFATVVNIFILSFASYRGVQYMDSVQFCGQTCHTVMMPEYTAYRDSPHARVPCVDCHIGPGAPWFVRSKLSGVRQVFAVAFRTYGRPIPSPVKNLRPARETCEQCHWPQRFEGDKFLVRREFADDEKNTETYTVLLLKIGGHTWDGSVGIHGRHLDTIERVRYVSTDRQRQVIPQVSYRDDNGKTVVFSSTDTPATSAQLAQGEHRVMDCMDCHNRPTHIFQLPEEVLDQALAEGRISPAIPYIKKEGVAVLRANYPNRETATQKIREALRKFYRTQYPQVASAQRARLDQAIDSIEAIYLRNVFPSMKIAWGTYPNNIGHQDSPGCFRCHDGSHASADGRVIPNDCSVCHDLLAVQEPNPKILTDLGLK